MKVADLDCYYVSIGQVWLREHVQSSGRIRIERYMHIIDCRLFAVFRLLRTVFTGQVCGLSR
jgi:hypothetical protein